MTALSADTLDQAAALLRDTGRFAEVAVIDETHVNPPAKALRCDAADCESEAYYLALLADTGVDVGFYTPDRWLSGSIEGDLVHTGDKIEDLLEEELVEQGLDADPAGLKMLHYRDDAKRFVFRSVFSTPGDAVEAADRLSRIMLAYDACFRELGDMVPEEDDELG